MPKKNMLPKDNEGLKKRIGAEIKIKTKIVGSGRTDAGVHAVGQSANFLCDKIENNKKFLNSLNYFLSKKDISISSIKKKKIEFPLKIWCKKKNIQVHNS